MPDKETKFGLTISNRVLIIREIQARDIIDQAVRAEESGVLDSVWVGDSILAKPRLEAIALMTAIAARTKRVTIAPGCLASFPLRHPLILAYQWASMDLIAEGRTILCVC